MQKQKQLRTDRIVPNQNISFPIGSIAAIKEYYSKLDLGKVFSPLKTRGRDINGLIQGLVTYKLTENLSVSKSSDWMNRDEVLEAFGLERFEQRTLFRVLEILGEHRIEVVRGIQRQIFDNYDFPSTDINMDWTSIVLHGDKCMLGKYGYSRDHRPDKKQIVFGVSELRKPINVPIGVTVDQGNTNDVSHFPHTFEQVVPFLKPGSLVVMDKGAHSKPNMERILARRMRYLCAKKWNRSDDKVAAECSKDHWKLIDLDQGLYGYKKTFPSRVLYYYFSERLREDHLKARARKAYRQLEEAKIIQRTLDNKRRLPKRFTVNNPLVDYEIRYQTKLVDMSEEEALKILMEKVRTGREGFFCLVSSDDLTLEDAIKIYREKDSIEKIINSLKNEIDITPLRVWKKESVYGAIIIGFIAQLIVSLLRYDVVEVRHTSTKFIRQSLMNLTVTVEIGPNGRKRRVFSNFDHVNRAILDGFRAFS